MSDLALPVSSVVVVTAAWGQDPTLRIYEVDEREQLVTLDRAQALVGGYVEAVATHPRIRDVDLVVNEEGRLLGLAPSILRNLVGNVAIVGIRYAPDGAEWVGLTKEQVAAQLALLRLDPDKLRVVLAGPLSKVISPPRPEAA